MAQELGTSAPLEVSRNPCRKFPGTEQEHGGGSSGCPGPAATLCRLFIPITTSLAGFLGRLALAARPRTGDSHGVSPRRCRGSGGSARWCCETALPLLLPPGCAGRAGPGREGAAGRHRLARDPGQPPRASSGRPHSRQGGGSPGMGRATSCAPGEERLCLWAGHGVPRASLELG